MSEDLVRERTSVSSPPTSVISYQRQLRLSLSEPTALSYRVTYESWLRQNLTELRAVVSAMRQHTEPTASFLELVRCTSKFVSASSPVRKRFSTPRRMNLFRVYCTYNDDGNLKPNEIHSYCEPDLCSHCCDFVIWATADTHVVRIARVTHWVHNVQQLLDFYFFTYIISLVNYRVVQKSDTPVLISR